MGCPDLSDHDRGYGVRGSAVIDRDHEFVVSDSGKPAGRVIANPASASPGNEQQRAMSGMRDLNRPSRSGTATSSDATRRDVRKQKERRQEQRPDHDLWRR